MALNYHVGQLVVVRDDEEQNWHCARIYQTSPVLVKLRPRSSPSKYKFMKPLEALTEHEAKNVLALEQQLRNGMDLGPDPPPMSLTAEEQTAYPSIAAKANSSFLTVILLIGTLSPVILNNLWLMTANVVNEGDGHQHFWWYTLVFDNYFMIVKGLMFSAFFYAFLPEPAKGGTAAVLKSMAESECVYSTAQESIHVFWGCCLKHRIVGNVAVDESCFHFCNGVCCKQL